jgi:hypothetical protein
MSQPPHAARLRAAGQPAMRVLCLTEGPDRGRALPLLTERLRARGGNKLDSAPPSHPPPRQAAPRTTHLESAPVSGLKSRPSQPVPDEREHRAPGSKNAPRAQSGPAPRKSQALLRDEGRWHRRCGTVSAEMVARHGKRLGPSWLRAYTRARVGGPDAGGVLLPRRRSKFLQFLNSCAPNQRHDSPQTAFVKGFFSGFPVKFHERPAEAH